MSRNSLKQSTDLVIGQYPCISAEECRNYVDSLLELRKHWTRSGDDRMQVFSLGTSAYAEGNPKFGGSFERYQGIVKERNHILRQHFGGLYEKVEMGLNEVLDEPAVITPNIGLPGFLIWLAENEDSTLYYPIHFDAQYRLIPWHEFHPGQVVEDVMTVTLPLQLPAGGGHLRSWGPMDQQSRQLAFFSGLDQIVETRSCVTHHYTPGEFVIQHGLVIHQPAPSGNFLPGDKRITLQFHGVKVGGTWEFFW